MKITRLGPGIDLVAEEPTHHVQKIRTRVDNGTTMLWFVLGQRYNGDEVFQYLSPTEAMALAKSLEVCAIAALKESA